MDFVLHDLPLAQGWALAAWATWCNPWTRAEPTSLGYVAQEIRNRQTHD